MMVASERDNFPGFLDSDLNPAFTPDDEKPWAKKPKLPSDTISEPPETISDKARAFLSTYGIKMQQEGEGWVYTMPGEKSVLALVLQSFFSTGSTEIPQSVYALEPPPKPARVSFVTRESIREAIVKDREAVAMRMAVSGKPGLQPR